MVALYQQHQPEANHEKSIKRRPTSRRRPNLIAISQKEFSSSQMPRECLAIAEIGTQ